MGPQPDTPRAPEEADDHVVIELDDRRLPTAADEEDSFVPL